eukprot:g5721.t1
MKKKKSRLSLKKSKRKRSKKEKKSRKRPKKQEVGTTRHANISPVLQPSPISAGYSSASPVPSPSHKKFAHVVNVDVDTASSRDNRSDGKIASPIPSVVKDVIACGDVNRTSFDRKNFNMFEKYVSRKLLSPIKIEEYRETLVKQTDFNKLEKTSTFSNWISLPDTTSGNKSTNREAVFLSSSNGDVSNLLSFYRPLFSSYGFRASSQSTKVAIDMIDIEDTENLCSQNVDIVKKKGKKENNRKVNVVEQPIQNVVVEKDKIEQKSKIERLKRVRFKEDSSSSFVFTDSPSQSPDFDSFGNISSIHSTSISERGTDSFDSHHAVKIPEKYFYTVEFPSSKLQLKLKKKTLIVNHIIEQVTSTHIEVGDKLVKMMGETVLSHNHLRHIINSNTPPLNAVFESSNPRKESGVSSKICPICAASILLSDWAEHEALCFTADVFSSDEFE